MPKPTSDAESAAVRVVIVTLDQHLASAVERARGTLRQSIPGLEISLHAAATWEQGPIGREQCIADIARADIIIVTMLFLDEHIRAVLPALAARRDNCDALVCTLSAGEVIKLTKLGKLSMDGSDTGIVSLLKRLRGSKKGQQSSGMKQVAMLRRLPQILRFIPGKAQDLRNYFLTLEYWLSGSTENITNMVRLLVDRYASGPREALRGKLPASRPIHYPDIGVYHPRLPGRITEDYAAVESLASGTRPKVGLVIMRSYVLAGNTAHYDGVIAALEKRGLDVIPAFATGLDARPAVDKFFKRDGRPSIDALVSLTGFSLVGGPAYNDSAAAAETLCELDIPYIGAQAIEFQTLEEWEAGDRGLLAVEATMMLAIPELDGSTGAILFGGRSSKAEAGGTRDMHVESERAGMLAARVAKLIRLRATPRADRKLAIVIFGFPPNAGSVGTAAFLSVYSSLRNTLAGLKAQGYTVDVPDSEDALRKRVLEGNASRYGSTANVFARIPADEHVRRETYLAEIEGQWGPSPGRHQSDGRTIHVLGAAFGNVLVAVQPSFGYEGDPMRLLFEKSFAPTHAFSAFYRYLREDFGANAILHFGTHGALEFMPGKQTALSSKCWPDRLISDVPNFYLYAANNPSEGTIAKRRAAATLVSYLTPAVAQAGLYRGLAELKVSLERWRSAEAVRTADQLAALAETIQAQAVAVDLAAAEPAWTTDDYAIVDGLWERLLELEYTLIPHGLHVVGEGASEIERIDCVAAMAEASGFQGDWRGLATALVAGKPAQSALTLSGFVASKENVARADELATAAKHLASDSEVAGLLRALDGRFVPPSPSGDLVRTPAVLPTGRNTHAFDPFKMPSVFAVKDGAAQAARLLARHKAEGHGLPETIAIVLWGTDNMKSEGGPIGQALALMGAKPRIDSYGRMCGAELLPLEALGRARVDVIMTLSGIFRDLLPLQVRMLAEAALLAAKADEPVTQNFIRKHALAYMAEHNCDIETAALRVFSNADSAYGSNVNHLIESGRWESEDELAECYTERKSFAYGCNGKPVKHKELLQSILARVDLTYQNLESVELGITTVDHYFDTLGGINRAARLASDRSVPVYIGDQTRGEGKVRTISEQLALETHTRALNPKWFEGMLKHGYEGVRHIEAQITNTMGWSATTDQVAPWIYQRLTETFVLDPEMRERLAQLNPTASVRLANRLIEAHERSYWTPDPSTLDALRHAGEELEDRMEGIGVEAAA